MLKPIVDSVIEKAPSRYALVIGVAKRARYIVDKAQRDGEILVEKPVGIAVDQLLNHEYEIVEADPEQNVPETQPVVPREAAQPGMTEPINMEADEDEDEEADMADDTDEPEAEQSDTE